MMGRDQLRPSDSKTPAASKILVIGAGVAGCSFAIRLRQRGIDVDLVEKEAFPRAKVCGCCLGPTGIEQLQELDLLDSVMSRSVTTNRWRASLGGRHLDLKIPAGIAVSREILDPMMVEAAQKTGARVRMQCSAVVESADDATVHVRLEQNGERTIETYDCVVVASGLRAGNLKGMLPWIEQPHGPFGVSFMASSSDVEPGTIYMACDADGYVGLVQLEGGQVDVAAALVSGSTGASSGDPLHRVGQILANSVFASLRLGDLTPLMATPPLRRTRVAGLGRVIAIGDAAGYVEPFTGEGMTWAMQGGIAAADLVARNHYDLKHIGEEWCNYIDVSVKRRKTICRVMTAMLRSPVACRVAATTLSVFPSLARPLLSTAQSKAEVRKRG
ncbi:NAD(P)/FAD-dependent oxidoreductase [Rubripirellula reticaptiva]|uniref:Kynurenine 3-monooxygenase n=1 Tax=Rubripirellula reticaptiva TaxID=2528013 RepID=A0A5C6ERB5_9BACT|nr:FAD-dependent oxidoreductase [Rubripirellula reticaptiva]TWU51165.1 Kynurenine 3-monooxygenase [Rubripirellula reticaptiva]